MAAPNAMQKETQRQIASAEKLFDNNEYVHSLRIVNKQLKKYPDHPETLALKALILNAQKKKDEAAPIIQQAVRADMQNAKIWKFQGIICKNNGEYTKAAQSLTMARKLNPADAAVLQDLCNLYLFERNYRMFADAARDLLKKNTYPATILRYAIALQQSGKLQSADQFLAAYEKNLMPTQNDDELVFRSELCLYHSDVIIERGEFAECEKYLLENVHIRDSVGKMERLVKAYISQDKKSEAIETIEKLIKVYPENGDYFDMLESLESAEEYMTRLFAIKESAKSRYAEVRILELMNLADDRFNGLLTDFLVPYLMKGTPSIFVYLAELSREKMDVAVSIARAAEVPLCYVPIVHNFVASVFIAEGKLGEALDEVDKGIAHTTTIIDLIGTKIVILLKMGRTSEAVVEAEKLSKSDPADRNTNTILVNTLLWNGQLKVAADAAKPFSADHDGKSQLFQSQYNGVCLRCARCAVRAGDNETALKFYNDVVHHVDAFRKSQFNYIGWGMRKTVALMSMLRWADELDRSQVLARAAMGIMKIKFAEGDIDSLGDLALRMTNAVDSDVLVFTSAYFARKRDPLPALKCFHKITGSAIFAAAPAIAQMMNDIGSVAPVVQEVAKELYKPFTGKPDTFRDLLMSARGCFFTGDIAAIGPLLLQGAAKASTFKEELEVYDMAKFELRDDALATKIEDLVHSRRPKAELRISGVYEVPEILSQSTSET